MKLPYPSISIFGHKLSNPEHMPMNELPLTGFIRLKKIIGDHKAKPPISPLIPVGKTTWWEGVGSGRFPPAYKLSPGVTAWKVEHIRILISNGYWRTNE